MQTGTGTLYYEEPYCAEFEANVLRCEPEDGRYAVILNQTAFYPEGGGQPADTGTLQVLDLTVERKDAAAAAGTPSSEENLIPVLDVHEKDNAIVHYTDCPIPAGSRVRGTIDWDRRFCMMQEHSGEHILSGLIHRKFGFENVGFHMGEEIRMDFSGECSWEELMEIEKKANEIIFRDLPIRVFFPTEEELAGIDYRSKKELTGLVRLVEIPGADMCACCGTHVLRTGEIGAVKILSMIRYKGGMRLMMHAGRKAMEDYRIKTDLNREICEMLSARPYESATAVRRILDADSRKSLRIAELQKELFQYKAETFPDGQKLLIDVEREASPVEIRRFCDLLLKKKKGETVCVLSGHTDESGNEIFSYCIGSASYDCRAAAKELNAGLNGRGGGSPQMVQGSFSASEDRIRSAVSRVFGG
ncbi:MAG: alanyl-tRNA editing protein [Clostridium sp.]|nr:alanyl-tRNA editing protein [Clostridium sp.]